MKTRHGFTLVELMIVIAIIAIVAAIAVIGIMKAMRGGNERNVIGSLKLIATAQADFRGNDRDLNQISDFWIDDVRGLYAMDPTSNGLPLRLIDEVVARSDADPQAGNYTGVNSWAGDPGSFPKAGYFLIMMDQYEPVGGGANPYDNLGTGRNTSRFGVCAFPDIYGSSGVAVLIINSQNTIYRRDGGTIGMTDGNIGVGGAPVVVYPSSPLSSGWGPID